MLWFSIVLVVLLLFVASRILRPLLSDKQVGDTVVDNREETLAAIYQEKLNRLEQQYEHDELDKAQYDSAYEELTEALAQELPPEESGDGLVERPRFLPWVVAVSLCILSIGLYFFLGRPDVLLDPNIAAAESRPPSIDAMVSRLEARLGQSPEDLEDWLMLGRSYTVLERFEDAKRAYGEALKRAPDDPQVLLDYAEAIARANATVFNDEAVSYLEQALHKDPKLLRGLILQGVVSFQRGKRELAVEQWSKLVPDANPEEQQLLNQFIAAAKGISQTEQQTASSSAAAGQIKVSVTLSKDLASRVKPNSTLFVYAKAVSGPPMPLAIERHAASALPIEVVLDDGDAMMEQMKLSNFEQVTVIARISPTGNATPASGDLQGASSALNPAENPAVAIEINSLVP